MPSNKNQPIDFNTLLASSVHDIKNSLATVRELVKQIAAKSQSNNNPDFIQLEFEANRMNNSLVQLLELYKIDSKQFNLNIDEHSAYDILQEVKAQQAPLIQFKQYNLEIDCAEDLYCYCDYFHICNALSSILNNAQRYSENQILLSAYPQKQTIVFCMEDDGKGFPDQLLLINSADTTATDWISSSTGLGLHFVSTLAALHIANNSKGYIKIDNESRLGGARFRLFLP